VSDVSLGYGSPQVDGLTSSLSERYSTAAVIFEPDQSGRPPSPTKCPSYEVRRISTGNHPYTGAGRAEYLGQVARQINALRPDMVAIFCTFCLPVLTQLRYRPRFVLYASIESIVAYGEFDVALNRHLASSIDLAVFPEENRARLDGARCGLLERPMAILYNVRRGSSNDEPRLEHRGRRMIYSGTVSRANTFADYFLDESVAMQPIDVFGPVTGDDAGSLRNDLFRIRGNVRYRGQVNAAKLERIRSRYSFSIVMWAPHNENQHYAAPNKFFDAIADGVPPIAAPHPQCEALIRRYGCGILMADWSLAAFESALEEAMRVYGTDRYREMVAGCRKACDEELNWSAQFDKLSPFLPEHLS